MRGTGTGLGVRPHFHGRSSPRGSGRRNLGVFGWAASGRLWRERGAGGGEARFERDAAERPPPDLSARAAGELGRRSRFARAPRCARRPGRRPSPAGKLGSPERRLPAAPEVRSGGRGSGGAGRAGPCPGPGRGGWMDGWMDGRIQLGHLVVALPAVPSLARGEGCWGEGEDGAASLRFPGVALLDFFFLLRPLKRSVSRKSSEELGVSCGQASAPTI